MGSFKLRNDLGSILLPRRKRFLRVVVVAKEVHVAAANVDEVVWNVGRWGSTAYLRWHRDPPLPAILAVADHVVHSGPGVEFGVVRLIPGALSNKVPIVTILPDLAWERNASAFKLDWVGAVSDPFVQVLVVWVCKASDAQDWPVGKVPRHLPVLRIVKNQRSTVGSVENRDRTVPRLGGDGLDWRRKSLPVDQILLAWAKWVGLCVGVGEEGDEWGDNNSNS